MRMPTIMIPYEGSCNKGCSDFFVYLRPESNGVLVESVLMSVITKNPRFQGNVKMVYFANFPGSFILDRKVVERHYALKHYFANHGKEAFSEHMKEGFSKYFGFPFEKAHIVGAFEALKILNLEPEELFKLWVAPFDMTTLNGQVIKRKDDLYILNYDIPALLHKNSHKTDIAIMVFRTDLGWSDIHEMIGLMTDALIENKILDPQLPPSRVFHYSKSPFESILDAKGYLIDANFDPIPISELTFTQYLLSRGYLLDEIESAILNPIYVFNNQKRGLIEEDLFIYTMNHTYEEADSLWKTAVKQVKII